MNGFVETVTDWRGDTITTVNDADGRMIDVARSNGVDTAYGYDSAGRLTSIGHAAGATVIDSFAYSLDGNGNRTGVTSNAGSESYTLDGLNRITAATYPGAQSETFVYDPAGNRTSHTSIDGTTTGYTVDATGQLISDTTGTTYNYDQAGNLLGTSDGDVYVYDDYGRATSITAGGATETYTYDAQDVRATVDGISQLWDRNGLPTLIETGAGDNYIHTNAGVMRDGDEWLLADAVGSVRATVDAAGNVSAETAFTAFGEPLTGQADSFGYAGEQLDTTGLVHLRARQYNPTIGRFTTVDPVQPAGPTTSAWNLYSYSRNNPTTWTDPTGQLDSGGYGSLVSRVSLPSATSLAAIGTATKIKFALAGTAVLGVGTAGAICVFSDLLCEDNQDVLSNEPQTARTETAAPVTSTTSTVPATSPSTSTSPTSTAPTTTTTPECPHTQSEYYALVTRIPQNSTAAWADYERRVVNPHGPQARLFGVTTAAGVTADSDGLNVGLNQAIDAKFTASPTNPMFREGGPPFVVDFEMDLFSRYGQILRDPCVPVDTLDVRVSHIEIQPFFEALLVSNAIPGNVTVVP